jgi:GT2 family glycosyltransferase
MTGVALITIAHGRHDHLEGQYRALALSTVRPDDMIVVAIDDPALHVLAQTARLPMRVLEQPGHPLGLPLGAARNRGAAAAIDAGADVLIFLDVDCMPEAGLVEAYRDAARDPAMSRHLLCGPVAYLPAPSGEGYEFGELETLAEPHPGRPAPDRGAVATSRDHTLFWSLSFALTAELWNDIGGFHEEYLGYGGEDTDFGQLARARGVDLAWIGSARSYHQFHPIGDPPVGHIDDILRNAAIYDARWGQWPMTGWLDEFQRLGLIRWNDDTSRYERMAQRPGHPSPTSIAETRS